MQDTGWGKVGYVETLCFVCNFSTILYAYGKKMFIQIKENTMNKSILSKKIIVV